MNVLGVGWMFYHVNSVKHEPEVWHVDPLTALQTVKPHSFRMAPPGLTTEVVDLPSPVYSANPTLMAKAFDDFVLSQSKTTRIAGSPEEGWMTYVQKSQRWGFPDYISVKFIDLNGGKSTIAIYSRSRFGHSDMGVNEARVRRWVSTLQSFVEDPENVEEPSTAPSN